MIKKLRIRFIQIAMLSLLAVIVVLVSSINIIFYFQSKRMQSEMFGQIRMLQKAEIVEGFPGRAQSNEVPPWDIEPSGSIEGERVGREGPLFSGYYVVILDENKEITDMDISKTPFIEETEARSYAEKILETDKTEGKIDNYRYEMYEETEGYMLIVIDRAASKASMRAVFFISTGVAFISYVLVFGLVVLFSKKAIRPLSESYERQKQFITDAGHELKTPLTVISANNEIARMSFGDCEWFDGIDKQTDNMQHLVRNLISLTRMDEDNAERLELEFSLSDAVYDTAMSYQGLAEKSGKQLQVYTKRDIRFHGDESALRQVVSILLDNAFKYSAAHGKIEVWLDTGKYIQLEVKNTCENIDQISMEKLFDRFYRGDKARAADGGYGLGLAIARAIVEKHNGRIKAYKAGEKEIGLQVQLRKGF